MSRQTVELFHSKVEDLNVDHGIIGRMLNYGTITVNCVGAGKTPVPSVSAPLQFRKHALAAIEQENNSSDLKLSDSRSGALIASG